jgi:hypothetical protein
MQPDEQLNLLDPKTAPRRGDLDAMTSMLFEARRELRGAENDLRRIGSRGADRRVPPQSLELARKKQNDVVETCRARVAELEARLKGVSW